MALHDVPAPHGWVPVERRWLGLDRATILPAVIVAVLAAVMALGIPAINTAVPGGVKVRAGEQVGLAMGIRFVPATGWVLTDGVRVGNEPRSGGYPATAKLTDGPVAFSVQTLQWDGSPTQLLERIKRTTDALNGGHGLHITGAAHSVQTAHGDRGVSARFRGTSSDGAVVAFVIGDVGVSVVITGPPDLAGDPPQAVADMLTSFEAAPGGDTK
jgi:hypothetical protein